MTANYQEMTKKVSQANIDYHTQLSDTYDKTQPHFLPENQKKVTDVLKNISKQTNGTQLLDLGCGTGFIINIAKNFFKEIHGVDITQAMLDKVDKSGSANIQLFKDDTGRFPAKENSYDAVTSYSFLHHIYDIVPTLTTAYKALKPGGIFYADAEPNYWFWKEINQLDRKGSYHPVVKREIENVSHVDEEVHKLHGISPDTINTAEYGKTANGGFKESDLREKLAKIGFSKVDVFYAWFIGEGTLINDKSLEKAQQFDYAEKVTEVLSRALPLSKGLFKYLGFKATK